MTVHELNQDEFAELRESLICQTDEMTDDEIIEFYEGTHFVKEDFFCNI